MGILKSLGLVISVLCILGAIWLAVDRRQESGEPTIAATRPIGVPVGIETPLGLSPVPIPADNPPTAETIALGRKLFFEPRLSVDDSVACAGCHNPDFGFSDGQSTSTGVGGQKGGRNAPSVINAVYYTTHFWDGRAPNLEKQAEGPVQNRIEMAHTLAGVERKLMADPAYQTEFEKAFGPGSITYDKVEKAIAAFERSVVSGNSAFDRYFYGGNQTAMSEAARRGFEVFRDPKKGNCATCHVPGLFTDNQFHNLGVGVDDYGELPDLGRYQVTKRESDRGAFKTASLRGVAQTAPYMHDGSLKTLKEVVDFYVGGGNSNPYRSPLIRSLESLTGQEREDLVAFLEALTGELPVDVRSPARK